MKNKQTIFFVSIILILIVIVLILFINNQKMNSLYELDGKSQKLVQPLDTSLVNTSHIITTGNLKGSDATYTTIYTFDENEKLIIQRDCITYSTIEAAQNYYNDLQQYLEISKFNISIKDTSVFFNTIPSNITKEEIINLCTPGENNTVTEINIY